MVEKEMIKRQQTTPAGREDLRSQGRYMTPAVDIYETEESLTLVADMPGVDKSGLNIQLEKGVLTLNGEVKPAGKGQPVFSEFSSASYYRQFKLSEHLDVEKTSADFVDGVLTLTMPKAEAAKPKRIEIRH